MNPLYVGLQPFVDWIKSQPGWNHLEIATGHDAMVTVPRELADMLLRIG